MAKLASLKRFTRRTLLAPWLVEDTREEVGRVRNDINDLRRQVETTGQSQVEALVLLTRAVDELNIRLGNLEDRRDATRG